MDPSVHGFRSLETGTRLLVWNPKLPAPRAVIVVRVKDGIVWISSRDRPGEADDPVVLEYSVPGDASYRASGRVLFVPPETWALRRVGAWQRVQRRGDVRVEAPAVRLAVRRVSAGLPLAAEPAVVLDLSAGGARVRTASPLSVGEELHCTLELPDARLLELAAVVVRVTPPAPSGGRGSAALCFRPGDEAARAVLLRWVFREQILRHRRERPGSPAPS